MKFVRKKISSIFTKLLVVIIVTGLCIILALGALFHFLYENVAETPMEKNIILYANYLVEDLGIPPQYERAVEIAKASSLKIRYDGPETHWATSTGIPDIDEVRLRIWHEGRGIKIARYRHHHLVSITRGVHHLTFDMDQDISQEEARKGLFIRFVVFSILILLGAYLFIRWILRPLKWLTEGVEQISKGNLEHQVPVKRRDELAELAEAFNAMTQQIKKMLHAKERLMLDVSHELRSPLTRLKVALEFLPEGATKESLKEDVAVMESMITEILETARLRGGYAKLNLKETDFVALVGSIIAGFAGSSPGVEAKDMPASMPFVVDPELCRTVLKNIITNAIKYSGSDKGPVSVSLLHKPPYVVVQVSDHGAGIPEEDLPYIFEPFYRVEKSRSQIIKGYGLGLNLCKTIMEAHKGRIEIESSPGKGTIVTLSFPEKVEMKN